jgi:CRP-like cAMP-binding protein
VFLNIMEPGDTFGEIALLDGRARTASAIATAPSDLLIIQREQFLRLLATEPLLTDHLLRLLCARLRWVSGFAEQFALLAVPARLARRLLSLGRLHGRETGAGIELKVSQDEMARFLVLSRQIVNQHLQSWKAKRWVGVGARQNHHSECQRARPDRRRSCGSRGVGKRKRPKEKNYSDICSSPSRRRPRRRFKTVLSAAALFTVYY